MPDQQEPGSRLLWLEIKRHNFTNQIPQGPYALPRDQWQIDALVGYEHDTIHASWSQIIDMDKLCPNVTSGSHTLIKNSHCRGKCTTILRWKFEGSTSDVVNRVLCNTHIYVVRAPDVQESEILVTAENENKSKSITPLYFWGNAVKTFLEKDKAIEYAKSLLRERSTNDDKVEDPGVPIEAWNGCSKAGYEKELPYQSRPVAVMEINLDCIGRGLDLDNQN